MQINSAYSIVSNNIHKFTNPARPWATATEEVFADFGRVYQGYKRGGILEGAEKFRKEVLSAIVWLGGIPLFKKLGDSFCQKFLTIPTRKIDFSNAKEGNNAIFDTANYLLNNIQKEGVDYSELAHFTNNQKFMSKLLTKYPDVNSLTNSIFKAKQVTSILAIVLNCAMMGIVIPKFNQHLTEKKLKKMQAEESRKNSTLIKYTSLNDFKKQTNKDVTFTGAFHLPNAEKISNLMSAATYKTEHNMRFALISTDVPMIIGRVATSRGIMEAFEYVVADGSNMYFYNFANEHVQKLLRKITKTPNIQPVTVESLTSNPEQLKSALQKIAQNPDKNLFKTLEGQKPDSVLKELFGNELAIEIYKKATYGKYGKANRFVTNGTIEDINQSVKEFIDYLKIKDKNVLNDGVLNVDLIKKLSKGIKIKNIGFLVSGLLVSILGLSYIIPKGTYALSRLISGKNEFTGLAGYNEQQAKKKQKEKA